MRGLVSTNIMASQNSPIFRVRFKDLSEEPLCRIFFVVFRPHLLFLPAYHTFLKNEYVVPVYLSKDPSFFARKPRFFVTKLQFNEKLRFFDKMSIFLTVLR